MCAIKQEDAAEASCGQFELVFSHFAVIAVVVVIVVVVVDLVVAVGQWQ